MKTLHRIAGLVHGQDVHPFERLARWLAAAAAVWLYAEGLDSLRWVFP